MSEFTRYKGHDHEYRAKQVDNPPPVKLSASVSEVRRIYPELDDDAFAVWYARRYRISGGAATVLAIMSRSFPAAKVRERDGQGKQ